MTGRSTASNRKSKQRTRKQQHRTEKCHRIGHEGKRQRIGGTAEDNIVYCRDRAEKRLKHMR
jgi:hypothetical protein